MRWDVLGRPRKKHDWEKGVLVSSWGLIDRLSSDLTLGKRRSNCLCWWVKGTKNFQKSKQFIALPQNESLTVSGIPYVFPNRCLKQDVKSKSFGVETDVMCGQRWRFASCLTSNSSLTSPPQLWISELFLGLILHIYVNLSERLVNVVIIISNMLKYSIWWRF